MAQEYWWKQYALEKYGVRMAESPYQQFGKSLPRITAQRRAQGQIQFTTDQRPSNILHAKILHCPYSHATLKSIDVSEAEALPGVVKVLTYNDADPIGTGPIYGGGFGPWYPLLPAPGDEFAKYGQPVAAVIAESENIADDAIDLIKAEYDLLLHNPTIDDAMKPDAPPTRVGVDNVGEPSVYTRGSVEEGLAAATYIAEAEFRPNRIHCNPIEPRQAMAIWEGDQLTLWVRTQNVWFIRDGVAGLFGVPRSKVRVICEAHGGGYGSTASAFTPCTEIAILGALLTGRPVRCSIGRLGEKTLSWGHGDYIINTKFGADADGKLTAMELISYNNGGAYGSGGITQYILDIYVCPNQYVSNTVVFSNVASTGAYRAVNDPHTNYAVESTMDMLAAEVGIDPIEFRRKNYVTVNDADQPPRDLPRTFSTIEQEEVTRIAKEEIGWDANWHEPGTRTLPNGKLHGIGFAADNDSHGSSGTVGNTFIQVMGDGTVQMQIGAVDNGNGLWTMCCIIAAEELGLTLDDVNLSAGADTFATSEHGGSWGSTRTVGTGWGATTAALDAKSQLAEAAIASFFPDATKLDLEFKDRKITNTKTGESKEFTEVTAAAYGYFGGPVIGRGYRPPDPPEWDAKYRRMNWAAHAVEIEVDPETGEVEVTKYVAVHTVGPVISRLTCENECDGGVVQGIGGVMSEEWNVDPETGICLNASWVYDKLPTAMDVPMIDSIFNERDPEAVCFMNHHGVRGFAEPPKTPNGAVISNAFYNATGIRPTTMPLTPDRVIELLR